MSRRVRNNTSLRGSKSNAALVRRILPWERRFLDDCNADPLARKAWLRLEKAGLGEACKGLLWDYADGPEHFGEIQRVTALIVRNVQAFDRAQREEQRRLSLSDPRAQMFRERKEAAIKVLARTPWRIPGMTCADAVRVYGWSCLFDLRRIRALVGRSGLNHMLVILRVGAMERGVRLSGNELAALAGYAIAALDDDGYAGEKLDGGAVRRILRESWIPAAEAGYRAVFEHYLHRVSSGRDSS
jgi:hypothetical protein